MKAGEIYACQPLRCTSQRALWNFVSHKRSQQNWLMRVPSLILLAIFATFCTYSAVAQYASNGFHKKMIEVSISPSSSTLQVGQSLQFTASISGTGNTAVIWLVNGTPGGTSGVGTVTSSGMYKAPVSAPFNPVSVTAQSAARTTASASATVSIVPATISISISPTNASVQTGHSEQFSAAVTGTSNTAIKWLVSGVQGGNPTVGTIAYAGLYTAPATLPSAAVVVTAQSSANPNTSASAGVTITQPVSHDVSLSWKASSLPVAGYKVYRGTQAAGPFTRINSTLETGTVYIDSLVTSGKTYYYATTSVDSSGMESGYSNVAQAAIP